MFKQLAVDSEAGEKFLKINDYSSLANHLNQTFKLERSKCGTPLPYEFSVNVLHFLCKILTKIIDEKVSENHKDILKELFRSLRNYVVNPEVQKFVTSDDKFLNDVKVIVDLYPQVTLDVLQIILQFLINLMVSNEAAALKVYNLFRKHMYFLLQNNVNVHEVTALLYNISLFKELDLNYEMYVCILNLCQVENATEFGDFLIDKFITYDSFWLYFKNFDLNDRLAILSTIRQKQIKGEKLNLPKQGVETLVKCFVSSGNIIFQTVLTNDNIEAYEISEILQVIASFCGTEEYLKILQYDKDLLITSGVLLINIHNLGKDKNNCFSSIQSLAEVREPQKNIREHPAFGFKADLIRIIGNLCWKNRIMQDLAREAELIPVILDCCNMDARNPFILQWVILTIRNLCENNLENQKIIAGLHQEGTVKSSALEEMGLTLDSSGEGAIKIVPLDALRDHKK